MLKYIKKQLQGRDIRNILLLFLIWRTVLLFGGIIAINLVPLRGKDFYGGGFENYVRAPLFYGWANFDGEHYLSIAQSGYKSLEHAFFPLYPILMNLITKLVGLSIENLIITGLLISNLTFLFSIRILFKLIVLDYSKKIAYLTIILILFFPTSFYFGSLYNESLFLLLITASFYLARRNEWFWASIFGSFSSITRVFGILLVPSFLIEAWANKKLLNAFWILIIPLGLFSYMYFLWTNIGDPVAFYSLQKIVGPQHESGITLLPQIYFRYFKILLTTPIFNPLWQTIVLELFVGVIFFILPIYALFKKMRYSYIFYALAGFILPTIQGSFSSLPRYVIILFPSFIALALLLNKYKYIKILVVSLLVLWLFIETALFLRGYWVA